MDQLNIEIHENGIQRILMKAQYHNKCFSFQPIHNIYTVSNKKIQHDAKLKPK